MAESKATPSHTAVWLYAMSAGLAAYCYHAMTETGVYVLPALILIAALAVLLPPARSRLKVNISLKLSIALAVAFLFGMAIAVGTQKANREEAALLKMQKDSAARIAKLKADREAEYAKNKTEIIAEVERLLSNNQPREALATISKYMTVTKDPDLGRYLHRADIQTMRLDLTNEASLSPERRADIYKALMQEDLEKRPEYEQKLKQMENLLAAKRQQQEDASKRAAMEASIKGQFSGYDGSHRKVEAAIKARLKDPGSYEHVETRYSVNPDSITVYTTYRARNSFNAVVPGTAVATVDAAGNVISLN